MRHLGLRLSLLLAPLALLTACAGLSQTQRADDSSIRAHYLAYAGAPIDHVTFDHISFDHITTAHIMRFEGWEAVSDNEAVIFEGGGAYLISVWQPCGPAGGLNFLNRLGNSLWLTHRGIKTVYAQQDSIVAAGWRCRISQIRPIDYQHMQRDDQAKRGSSSRAV